MLIHPTKRQLHSAYIFLLSFGSTVVDMLFLRLVPTFFEMVVLAFIFTYSYGAPEAGGILASSFFLYCGLTWSVTHWRRKIRQSQAAADNVSNAIAVDSLTAFETVKAFTAEKYELTRYQAAIAKFQVRDKTDRLVQCWDHVVRRCGPPYCAVYPILPFRRPIA